MNGLSNLPQIAADAALVVFPIIGAGWGFKKHEDTKQEKRAAAEAEWKRILGARLDAQDTVMETHGNRAIRIEAQLHRNGGASLFDAVIRTEGKVDKLTGRVDEHVRQHDK
jgi:hypothetical protein